MDKNNINNLNENSSKNILVLGGSDGIGLAICNVYEKLGYNIHITSRAMNKYSSKFKFYSLDATKEESWQKFIKNLSNKNITFDIIINTIGILHDANNNAFPEKSIKGLNANFFMRNIEVNTLVSALCMKYLLGCISKTKNTIIAHLTARLGSISDNNIGGWISYRASKAAQHMVIKTSSLELIRNYNRLVVVGLHPGTVDTKLSKPFQKSAKKIFEPRESALKLTKVISNLEINDTGKVFDYAGKIIPY
ncbi:MAG: C-factor [Alphaproteobacteria bacterium MarineAlpha9_Bin3]|nr:MAG: C-factor [Alphaproteobacteria bacterium MarineAlpha9_Bin3]|tara:strand:- start:739 stop:1488 length:750 start_codon:yes stop_codon:yes gene_type:complete